MKKKMILACLCGVAVMASQGAMASSLKLRGGVTNNNYTLDRTSVAGTNQGNVYTSAFSGRSLGVTWLADDASLYLDYAASSGSGMWTRAGVTNTDAFTRDDNAIVLGTNSVGSTGMVTNLYVGWKNGKTDASWAKYNNGSISFQTSGVVFGGGLGIPAAGGMVLLNLGLGVMGGKYDNVSNAGVTTTNDATSTVGYSYGIGYTYPFTQNIGMTVDYKAQGYKYTFLAGLSTEWGYDEALSATSATVYVKF